MDDVEFERLKLALDSVKHITTLATGVIVLTATFYDKLPKPITFRLSLFLSLSFMLICLAAAFCYLFAAGVMGHLLVNANLKVTQFVFRFFGILTYGSFMLGILCLWGFAVRNLYLFKVAHYRTL
jgi:hypothetical protein